MTRKPISTLGRYLKEHGITQQAFADRLGITQSYLSQICAGKKVPSLPVALEIERLTGVSVKTLATVTR